MSSSNVFNNYNKVLLRENYYNYKFNPYKREAQKKTIISLIHAIKNNDNDYDCNSLKHSDSLSTIDAMNNPYMLKFSEEEKNPYEIRIQNNGKLNKKGKKKTINKAIDIQRYSDCVKITENKTAHNGYCLSYTNNKNRISNYPNLFVNSAKNRPLSFKTKSPVNNDLFLEEKFKDKFNNKYTKKFKNNKKFDKIKDKNLNINNNKNFKDTLSCFIYHINNFTSKEFEFRRNSVVNINTKKNINYNIDMTSDFTKNLKKIKFIEIKREEFDPSNMYFIQKPLIPTIRGKILKNMKKRYRKPIRNVVTCKNRESTENNKDN